MTFSEMVKVFAEFLEQTFARHTSQEAGRCALLKGAVDGARRVKCPVKCMAA